MTAVDNCPESDRYTLGARRLPVTVFLENVIGEYTTIEIQSTGPTLPTLETAIQRALLRCRITDFALVDLRRAIIQVMRDRGAQVEQDSAGTRFVWASYDVPVRSRIIAGLHELGERPERWMTPTSMIAEPDCDGGDAVDLSVEIARVERTIATAQGVYDRSLKLAPHQAGTAGAVVAAAIGLRDALLHVERNGPVLDALLDYEATLAAELEQMDRCDDVSGEGGEP
jgi:hypothetical protein